MQILVKGASWSPNIGNVNYNGIKNYSIGEGTDNPLWYPTKEELSTVSPAVILDMVNNPRGNTYIRKIRSSYDLFSGNTNNQRNFYGVLTANINLPVKSQYLSLGFWFNMTTYNAIKELGSTFKLLIVPAYNSSAIVSSGYFNLSSIAENDYTDEQVSISANNYVEAVTMNTKRLATEVVNDQTWVFIQVKFEYTWKQAATDQKPSFQYADVGIGAALRAKGSGTLETQVAGFVISDTDKDMNPYIDYPFAE